MSPTAAKLASTLQAPTLASLTLFEWLNHPFGTGQGLDHLGVADTVSALFVLSSPNEALETYLAGRETFQRKVFTLSKSLDLSDLEELGLKLRALIMEPAEPAPAQPIPATSQH